MTQPLVFDVETQHSFQETQGDIKKLKVAVVGVYNYKDNKYETYFENQLPELFCLFEQASYLIGFNINKFDLPVLSPYYIGDIFQFACSRYLRAGRKIPIFQSCFRQFSPSNTRN